MKEISKEIIDRILNVVEHVGDQVKPDFFYYTGLSKEEQTEIKGLLTTANTVFNKHAGRRMRRGERSAIMAMGKDKILARRPPAPPEKPIETFTWSPTPPVRHR